MWRDHQRYLRYHSDSSAATLLKAPIKLEGDSEKLQWALAVSFVHRSNRRKAHSHSAPANSSTQYFNYKHTFSVVLLAMCDANYCFTIVDIGAYGRQSDGGVLYNSNFGRALREGKLDIPSTSSLPHATDVAPYVVVGDEAFPLQIGRASCRERV